MSIIILATPVLKLLGFEVQVPTPTAQGADITDHQTRGFLSSLTAGPQKVQTSQERANI